MHPALVSVPCKPFLSPTGCGRTQNVSGNPPDASREVHSRAVSCNPTFSQSGIVIPSSSRARHIHKLQGGVSSISGGSSRFALEASNSSISVSSPEEVASPELINELVAYLEEELPKLFLPGGMSPARFEDKVVFEDPITQYDSISGYLFNILMLRYLFDPALDTHSIKQTAPNEITTRWTMRMTFKLLPWQPEVVFTGVSIYGVNPKSGKFVSHKDVWDSIQDNRYFSQEGLVDLLKQVSVLTSNPAIGRAGSQLPYETLRRAKDYEVRRYPSFTVAETSVEEGEDKVDAVADVDRDSLAVTRLRRYMDGGNASGADLGPGMPLRILLSRGQDMSIINAATVQMVLPQQYTSGAGNLLPKEPKVRIKKVSQGTYAALTFTGAAAFQDFLLKVTELGNSLQRDNIEGVSEVVFARYQERGFPPFLRRNEVLIKVSDFTLE